MSQALVPMQLFHLSPIEAGVGYSIALFIQFWEHTNVRVNIGPLKWLFITPQYHRVHHSALPEHYNSNYAALLPIFDVLCGSYNRPDGWPPTGLDTKPESLGDLITWPVRQGQTEATQSA